MRMVWWSDSVKRSIAISSCASPFKRPPRAVSTTRPWTFAPRSAIIQSSTFRGCARVARNVSPGWLRREESDSPMRTGITVPAASVTVGTVLAIFAGTGAGSETFSTGTFSAGAGAGGWEGAGSKDGVCGAGGGVYLAITAGFS